MPGSNFHPWHLVCKCPHYSSHMENFSCSCWRCTLRKSLIMKPTLRCSNEKFLQGCFLHQGQRVMQPLEFRRGFFVLFLIFGLSSLLDPLKYFLPSFCSCVSCCLATFLWAVGQGRAPDRLWPGCQHHPLATRPGTGMLAKGCTPASNPCPHCPCHTGHGGVPGATIPACPHSPSKALAGTQWTRAQPKFQWWRPGRFIVTNARITFWW